MDLQFNKPEQLKWWWGALYNIGKREDIKLQSNNKENSSITASCLQ